MKTNFEKSHTEKDRDKKLFDTVNGIVVKERFADIPNYKGIYQISTFGRIKSLERTVTRKDGKPYVVKEKILNQTFDSGGYLTIKLYKGECLKNFKTHVLMAIVFKQHIQTGTTETVVDHKDNNKTNNCEWNLQLISHRENCSKDIKNKTSLHTGVSWFKNANKWRASISINGKVKHLGLFKSEIEASEAYKKALKSL